MAKAIQSILIISACWMCMAMSCSGSKSSSNEAEGVWMQTEPIQCLQNPWEKAWLEDNNKDYKAYPKGKPREVEPEEAAIIKEYFEDQGITVLGLDARSFGDDVMVCEACSCPQGYTLYLKVKKADQPKMEKYKFIVAINYPDHEENEE